MPFAFSPHNRASTKGYPSMLGKIFDKLFRKTEAQSEEAMEQLEDQWLKEKDRLMESILGKEHDTVMHSIIPFCVGGGLDLYYYPHAITGTGIATKELAYACQESSRNNVYDKYELAMFTRCALDLDRTHDMDASFGKMHCNINLVLNYIARYSAEASLNPEETCEFPEGMEEVGGKCLVFADFESQDSSQGKFGVLVIIEIFRSEMEFARQYGGGKLIRRLKEIGSFPYSGLDRNPVV